VNNLVVYKNTTIFKSQRIAIFVIMLLILACSCGKSSPAITKTVTVVTTSTNTTTASSLHTTFVGQTIEYSMPASIINAVSVSYNQSLTLGANITGIVQLTGQPKSRDASFLWTFQVIGPGGELVYDFSGDWMNNYYHPFSFVTKSAGLYKIVVTHHSSYVKDLVIQVNPGGWSPSITP
jgi:hypothetical protein